MKNGDLIVPTVYEFVYDDLLGWKLGHVTNSRADEVDIRRFSSWRLMNKWHQNAIKAYGADRMEAADMSFKDLFGDEWYARWRAKKEILWCNDELDYAKKAVDDASEKLKRAVQYFEELS